VESRLPATRDEPSHAAWRTQTRKELVERRLSVEPGLRASWGAAINQHLLQTWPEPPGRVIAFCWPFRAEHDLRDVIERWISMGATAAMPVVVAPKSPLIFRPWQAGAPMEKGALGIPVPADPREIRPDTILLPANGFDSLGFRLGYGAGYFDRTIAELRPQVRVIGIAFEIGRLDSIRPHAHDQVMDVVVTEAGVHTSH
jgi:5-formyltetrahydrofolate cyclo-ligase